MAISNSNFSPGWEISQEWDGLQGGGSIESYYYYKKQKTRTKQAQPPSIDQKIPVKRSLEQVIAESKKLGVLPADK